MKSAKSNASDNDAVDAKIRTVLREKGPLRNELICEETSMQRDPRAVDRGLQRLRQRGEIELVSKPGFGRRWQLKEAKA